MDGMTSFVVGVIVGYVLTCAAAVGAAHAANGTKSVAQWAGALLLSPVIVPVAAWRSVREGVGETEAERLRKEIELLRRRLAFAQNAEDAAEKREERQRRRTAAAKGVATKLRRSIAAGQCPCCRKRFADLQEHMEQRHPAFAEAAEGTR